MSDTAPPTTITRPLTAEVIERRAWRVLLDHPEGITYEMLSVVSPEETRTHILFTMLQRCRRGGAVVFLRRLDKIEWMLTRSGRELAAAILTHGG